MHRRMMRRALVCTICCTSGSDNGGACYENRSFVPIDVDRGALVDPEALAAALNEGRLGGAGLDVFEPEILPGDSPLRTAANILLTSHTAWYSEDSLQDARVEAVESVIEVLGE